MDPIICRGGVWTSHISLPPVSMFNQHISPSSGRISRAWAPQALDTGVVLFLHNTSTVSLSFPHLSTGELTHGVPTIHLKAWSLSLFLFCPLISLHTSKHSVFRSLLTLTITYKLIQELRPQKRRGRKHTASGEQALPTGYPGFAKGDRRPESYGLCSCGSPGAVS